MLMKFGRKEFDITNKDIIMDNRFCYQLMSQENVDRTAPQLAKTKAKQMIKEGKLILVKETGSDEKKNKLLYYRFNIE